MSLCDCLWWGGLGGNHRYRRVEPPANGNARCAPAANRHALGAGPGVGANWYIAVAGIKIAGTCLLSPIYGMETVQKVCATRIPQDIIQCVHTENPELKMCLHANITGSWPTCEANTNSVALCTVYVFSSPLWVLLRLEQKIDKVGDNSWFRIIFLVTNH